MAKLDLRHVILLPWLLIVIIFPILNDAQQSSTVPRMVEHPEDQYVSKNDPATLNCKADGDPQPVITWYRDGRPVTTADENPSSHRMQLPSGQLFFLRIIHNRGAKPDVGIYYCVATNPETGESVQSRNATLDIATIRDDFRAVPEDTQVAVGETARLECRPPRGQPDPRVTWKINGDLVVTDNSRVRIDELGNLIIAKARRADTGRYVCIATNKAAEKETPSVQLDVMEKPIFINAPEDSTVNDNEDVTFQCSATGDPSPLIIWTRDGGKISQGRSRILDDRSLQISRVKVSDEGNYVCTAQNEVGSVLAVARLTVHTQPSFTVTPQDKVVGVGRRVSLRCEVAGNPRPAVFWNKATSQILMFPRQDHGRYGVSDSGTLTINPVRKEDAGEYECQALSVAGSALAKANVEVRDVDPRPPPIIHQGPQNQTLPVSTVAMLQCHSSGRPPPTIRWFKDNQLITHDDHITQLSSGTLQISALRNSDTGMYTCKAVSETGETSWSAALNVEDPGNKQVIFHRSPEPSTFPGRPAQPTVSGITSDSVSLAWKANANHGASPVKAYAVEYFSHETGEGWVLATGDVSKQSYTVRNLRPDTGYLFLIRAKNNHGVSLPSEVAGPYRTAGTSNPVRPTLDSTDFHHISQKLSGQIIEMNQPEVISSTKIKITWQVVKARNFIEGFHVKYRVMPDIRQHLQSQQQNSDGHYHHHVEYTIETISSPDASAYLLDGLDVYTWYEIRVQPFYVTIEGQESNTVRARTAEDVPSAPPRDILLHMLGNNTLRLSWATPASEHHNGPLRGYKIFLHGNETKFSRNITTNSSVHSVVISHLVPTISYGVQMAAFNRMGVGKRSIMQNTAGDTSPGLMTGIVRKPWFIATLIGTIGGTLWFALCVFSVWLYRKRRARKKIHKNGVMNVPVHKADEQSRLGSYLNSLGTPTYLHKDFTQRVDGMQPDITNIRGSSMNRYHDNNEEKENLYNTPNVTPALMKTFNNTRNSTPTIQSASPYATTTLVAGGKESAFRPIQAPGYTNGSSGAADMSSASDHSDPTRMHNDSIIADNYIINASRSPASEYGSLTTDDVNRSGFAGSQQPVLFLPPPPEHPPPSDIGTPPDSPTSDPRHAMLPHGGRSSLRGTAPYSHLRGSNGPSYSDGEYQQHNMPMSAMHQQQQQQPLLTQQQQQQQCRTMSPRSHVIDNVRAYSPVRAMSEPERGPTPPVRAYKLVPLSGDEMAVASQNGAIQYQHLPHHISDNESGMVPIHMYTGHTPPSPAPQDHLNGGHPLHMHPQSHPHGGMLVIGEDGAPMMDNGCQPSLPSLEQQSSMQPQHRMDAYYHHGDPLVDPELNAERYMNGAESPELLDESDMEHMGVNDQSPGSSVMDGEENQNGEWVQNSDEELTSETGSSDASTDGSFFAEADFASAVARAAELSGLTVQGSVVTDPNQGQREQRKVRKSHRQRERAARPSSPYSTDSNYSSVAPAPRYVPRSERKRHINSHKTRNGNQRGTPNGTKSGHSTGDSQRRYGAAPPAVKAKPNLTQNGDIPSYHRPNFPSPTSTYNNGNSNSAVASPRLSSTPKIGTKSPPYTTPNGYTDHNHTANIRTNPLAANFGENTPIV